MEIGIDNERKFWKHFEYLGLYCFKQKLFCSLISKNTGIVVPNNIYIEDEIDLESFIENDESKFVNFILSQNIHAKSQAVEIIYFHPKIIGTRDDLTNFGPYKVCEWYPHLIDELKQINHFVVGNESEKVGVKITSREELFSNNYEDFFLDHLVAEINSCFVNEFFISSAILCRKLCEILIFRILEKKFPDQKDLWWNDEYKQPRSFARLISNLNKQSSEFNVADKPRIESICEQLFEFKNFANKIAHDETKIPNERSLRDCGIGTIIMNLSIFYNSYGK